MPAQLRQYAAVTGGGSGGGGGALCAFGSCATNKKLNYGKQHMLLKGLCLLDEHIQACMALKT